MNEWVNEHNSYQFRRLSYIYVERIAMMSFQDNEWIYVSLERSVVRNVLQCYTVLPLLVTTINIKEFHAERSGVFREKIGWYVSSEELLPLRPAKLHASTGN